MGHERDTPPHRTEGSGSTAKALINTVMDATGTEDGEALLPANAHVAMIIDGGRACALGMRPNGRTDRLVARVTQRRVVGHPNRFARPLIAPPNSLAMRGRAAAVSFARTESPNGRPATTPIATGEAR